MNLPDIKKRSPTKKGEKKTFLKKPKKKVINDVKLISQKRMDIYFWSFFIGLIALCVGTVVLAFTREARPVTVQQADVVEINPVEVDNRLQEFLGSYIESYFNVSGKTEDLRLQEEYLNTFYNFAPDVVNVSMDKKESRLISYRPVEIKDGMASYRVTYGVGSEEDNKKVTVLFSVPFGGEGDSYYVSGLPNFKPIADYRATEVDAKDQLKLSGSDKLSEEEKAVLDDFVKLFFTNYTTSQENLDVMSNELQSINGVGFSSLDYSYYDIGEKRTKAYVQVTFDILGSYHPENFVLIMEEREKGYFVTGMEHVIPSNYAK